eukprot:CAMPEP_0172691516 /NCGR_PEP_ID=MMETSP1074-20121228/24604_1 /TAXON_ID=2916 /ORGANISM="Ceratium fusus, Strain PA161109" /LENGTH=590 /DNA_ID=CAMNT_0013511601 /DNA_START=59 /DNA_END=1831 /DNA_ORIENTATION=+
MATVSLRFSVRALEADAGLSGTFLAPHSGPRLVGKLRSSRVPADFQRHEVGPRGEVVHLAALGLGSGSGPGAGGSSASWVSADEQMRNARSHPLRSAKRSEAVASKEPWTATVYARGQRPDAARRVLASALQLPRTAVLGRGALHTPGISVQLVTFPRGLPTVLQQAQHDGPLVSGLLTGQDPLVAVGASTLLAPEVDAVGSTVQDTTSRRQRRGTGPENWQCQGHSYSVVLRNLSPWQCEAGIVEDGVARFATDGFINAFELGDFGLAEVRRYEVGAALWAGKWDLAAKLLLVMNQADTNGEGCHSSPASAAAAAFRSGDLARGVELLPEDGTAEGLRALALQLLLRRPALEALQRAVPKPVWARHLSAVSRLAWSRAAAIRLRQMPHRPMPGDLIWDESAGEARALKADEVDMRRLADVVLPLPRPGEVVPECPGRLQMEATLDKLTSGQADPEVAAFPINVGSLMPRFRHLVCVPSDVSWDIVEAADGPVVDCDLTKLIGDEIGTVVRTPEADDTKATNRRARAGRRSAASGRSGGGSGVSASLRGPALRARFTLPRGSSAEAALRELLHAEASEFCEDLGRRDELF